MRVFTEEAKHFYFQSVVAQDGCSLAVSPGLAIWRVPKGAGECRDWEEIFRPKTFDLMSMASDGPQKRNMPARRERESYLFDTVGFTAGTLGSVQRSH